MRFYLGTHRPYWLWLNDPPRHPLFVSHRTLGDYKKLRQATADWALDSGGFTELSMFGSWRTTATDYVAAVRRYRDEIGRLAWAAPQDWMCEPFMVAKTGLSVAEHQRRTVDNLLELRALAPDLPFIPVLQGWEPGDYLDHVEQYVDAGVDPTTEATVGIGSVCRRAHLDEMAALIVRLHDDGIRLHGFGIRADGVQRYGWAMQSSDSLAWSYAGRKRGRVCGGQHKAKSCGNCLVWAQMWADRTIQSAHVPVQMTMEVAR